MVLEYFRGMDAHSPGLNSIRNEVIDLVLSTSGQFLLLLSLLSWHLALIWITAPSRNGACPQRRHCWECVATGESCKTLLVVFVVAAYLNTGTEFEHPGYRGSLLFGIDQSTNLLVLLLGIVVSQISSLMSKVDDRNGLSIRYSILGFLVVFLAAASLAPSYVSHAY